MTSARFKLDNTLKPSASDDEIVALAALALLENEPEVYRLGINHDVRAAACKKGGPRTGFPPIAYHWGHRDLIGIETPYKHVALHWTMEALRKGYTVRYVGKDRTDAVPGYSVSLEKCRRRIEYANRSQSENADDDIPF